VGSDHIQGKERKLLYETLCDVRNSAKSICGKTKLSLYGLGARPPRAIFDLTVYCELAVGLLRSSPDTVVKAGMLFDPIAVADTLEELQASAEGALNKDTDEFRDTQKAKAARDRAEVAWRRNYMSVARQVEHLLRKADLDPLADKMRPNSRLARGENPSKRRKKKPDAPKPDDQEKLDESLKPAEPAIEDV
jgi:hypothetical protein